MDVTEIPKVLDQASDDESDHDDVSHQKLLQSFGINGDAENVDRKNEIRIEASQDVSVFALSAASGDPTLKSKVHLHELLKGVKESVSINSLKKQINRVHRSYQQLDAPLSTPVAERLQRKLEFNKTSEKLAKWDPIVQSNRKAEHLSFPRQQEPLAIKTVDQFLSVKKKKLTPLEEEIYALLRGSKFAERPESGLSVKEEELLASVSVEEARERRAELQKHRALLSYHETKMKRQKKIKSRKYHRMLRKRKMKEDAANDAPDEENEVQRADRLRAEERASLRHRMGSKWAKSHAIMAKSDATSKDLLNEQLKKHRELVEKYNIEEDQDPEEEENENECSLAESGNILLKEFDEGSNPWLKSGKSEDAQANRNSYGVGPKANISDNRFNGSESQMKVEDDSGNFTADHPAENLSSDRNGSLHQWLANEGASISDEENTEVKVRETDAMRKFKEAYEKLREEMSGEQDKNNDSVDSPRPEMVAGDTEEGLVLAYGDKTMSSDNGSKGAVKVHRSTVNREGSKVNTDASKVFSAETATVSRNQANFVEDEGSKDDVQRMTIEQAFADDDVIAEFSKAKKQAVAESKPEDINLSLPGWGEWGGAGIKPSRRKKRRFRVKAAPAPLRSDQKLGHVILNEKRDAQVAQHQVDSLPFPFTTEEQFEGTIARPVGETWNTPSTFHSFVKPKVTTAIGAVIPPMHSDEALEELKKAKQSSRLKRKVPSSKTKRKQQHQDKLRKLVSAT